jgi:hypothetical protein
VRTILVVANETLGGRKLLDKVRERAGGGDARVVVVVPRTNPRHGNVIYDESVFDAAQVRIDLARQVLRDDGIEAVGEVGDPDPYTAAMDALSEYRPDEIILSTYPAVASGWLRRDLVGRLTEAAGVPVEHVIQDIDAEGVPYDVTLVAANRTANDPELLDRLKQIAQDRRRHLLIFVVPQEGGEGLHAQRARARLAQVLDRARAAGLVSAGMIGDPDPYTAIMNALQFFRVEDIVISTLPATRSGWMRADLVERVRKASGKPVIHVEEGQAAPAAA